MEQLLVKKMKGIKKSLAEEYLYLDFSHQIEGCIFPLHTSVTLFLLSYCDCKIFKVYLVLTRESTDVSLLKNVLSQDVEVQIISKQELPPIVQNCCLPAVVERPDNFCRAGLAVVLRHIIQKSYEADPSKKEVLELLGFKKTCLKACAELLRIFSKNLLSSAQASLQKYCSWRKKLSEPVRVHNDDKLRRQKLRQQKAAREKTKSKAQRQETSDELDPSSKSLELKVAFSQLTVQGEPAAPTREPAHIRKAKASDLPPLEHVFAEGLYFTLTDIVLLPCVHHFLLIICKKLSERLIEFPLLAAWYQRIQEVPRVKTAASQCGIQFCHLPELLTTSNEQHPNLNEDPGAEEQNDPSFIGGPRPTMTKLMEKGIEVMFSPHPCPTWTIDWSSLPAAVSPKEAPVFLWPPADRSASSQRDWPPGAISSGHPPMGAPPEGRGRDSGWPMALAGGTPIGGWPEENWSWRKTDAGSHSISHPEFRHRRLPPAPWVLPQHRLGRPKRRESPPPAPPVSQSATLSPAPRASSWPNRCSACHTGSLGLDQPGPPALLPALPKLAMALKSFCHLAHITWLLRSRLEALISKMVACERYCLMLSHQPQLLQLLLLKAQAEEGL
ncbi:hypothetical protein QTO34_008145 [Cnephaeus nilssonii]|uniref:Glutathione S-transferase C-terminal domain-containing protein n=1 Tax=Cnephaeus nilssonii TaxID=3371016 RepID=A0AA40IAN8_CNENI|nr:hypothetical protein QTO34_008145 [Eptesicus nilssonii]